MFSLLKTKTSNKKAKILLVDDEPDLLDTIRRRLQYCKWDVIIAANGQEAVQKALSEHPDIILLDVKMPMMNGHETLRQLRETPALKETPVIMVTASTEVSDITTASSYNIAGYLTKPFDFCDLVQKIEEILAK